MNEFIEFEISSIQRFEKLQAVVSQLTSCKKINKWHSDASWLEYFDNEARACFWWPTQEELEEWKKHWFSTPVQQRFTEPSLKRPWILNSMLDALKNGDCELIGCKKISEKIGQLEFIPQAHPYGGTDSMKALIESFGHRVVFATIE